MADVSRLPPAVLHAVKVKQQQLFTKALLQDRFENAAGSVSIEAGEATVYSWDTALCRLHDLHFGATKQPGVFPEGEQLTTEEALSLFRIGVTSLMVQMQMLPASASISYLDQICDVG